MSSSVVLKNGINALPPVFVAMHFPANTPFVIFNSLKYPSIMSFCTLMYAVVTARAGRTKVSPFTNGNLLLLRSNEFSLKFIIAPVSLKKFRPNKPLVSIGKSSFTIKNFYHAFSIFNSTVPNVYTGSEFIPINFSISSRFTL